MSLDRYLKNIVYPQTFAKLQLQEEKDKEIFLSTQASKSMLGFEAPSTAVLKRTRQVNLTLGTLIPKLDLIRKNMDVAPLMSVLNHVYAVEVTKSSDTGSIIEEYVLFFDRVVGLRLKILNLITPFHSKSSREKLERQLGGKFTEHFIRKTTLKNKPNEFNDRKSNYNFKVYNIQLAANILRQIKR
jgi:hypothetical protein